MTNLAEIQKRVRTEGPSMSMRTQEDYKWLLAEVDRLRGEIAKDEQARGIIRRAAALLLPESEQVTEVERLWVALSTLVDSCRPIGTMTAEVPLSAVAAASRALLGSPKAS